MNERTDNTPGHLAWLRGTTGALDEGRHIIQTGDFYIDLDLRTVQVNGRDVELDPEEFDLLLFLTRNPTKIITPHTVLNTRLAAGRVRNIDVFKVLLSLRRRLEAVSDSHYIRTEPWVFYRFDPEPSS